MTFARCRNPIHHNYTVNGISLNRVSTINTFVGIHLTLTLNYAHHNNISIGKALKVLGFIKRNTKIFYSLICFRAFYLPLVRSIFEYGVVVWNCY